MAPLFKKGMVAAARKAEDLFAGINPSAGRNAWTPQGSTNMNIGSHPLGAGPVSRMDESAYAGKKASLRNVRRARGPAGGMRAGGGDAVMNDSALKRALYGDTGGGGDALTGGGNIGAGPSTIKASDAAYSAGGGRVAGPSRRPGAGRGYSNRAAAPASPMYNHPQQMTKPANPVPTTGGSMNMGMATGMGIALGAGTGAAGSYMTGGNIGQGALAGAAGGAAMGLGGASMAMRGVRQANVASGKAGYGFSSGIANTMKSMDTAANRAYMFGGGGMLGGMAFGGNKSHRRGFNKNRGNTIGR